MNKRLSAIISALPMLVLVVLHFLPLSEAIVTGSDILITLLYIALFRAAKKGEANSAKSDEGPGGMFSSKRCRILAIASAWFAISSVLTLAFGEPESEELLVSMSADPIAFFGMKVNPSILTMTGVVIILFFLAIAFRLVAFPRFKDQPGIFQGIIETVVETVASYAKSQVGHDLGTNLPAYLFSLGLTMFGCACAEFFHLRSPTSDIAVTAAMGLISFVLVFRYGFKVKGVFGRMASGGAIAPIKLVSDIAAPVSLACRLFGNMMGGLIVMDLLYSALGYHAVGVHAVAGLYFTLAHPALQIYVFVTLSLSFIRESIE